MLAEENNQADTPEILQRILRYLEARLDQPVSIGELAEEFRLSQATLRRLFRKHLGESPVDFLIRRRMETAMRLLRVDRAAGQMDRVSGRLRRRTLLFSGVPQVHRRIAERLPQTQPVRRMTDFFKKHIRLLTFDPVCGIIFLDRYNRAV